MLYKSTTIDKKSLELFVRSIDINGLLALVPDLETDNLILLTRDGKKPKIEIAYQPRRIEKDIRRFLLTRLPSSTSRQLALKENVADYVLEHLTDSRDANAFNLSNPEIFCFSDGTFQYFSCVATFFKIYDF